MKTPISALFLVGLLSAVGTTTALAHGNYDSEGSALHWLSDVSQQASTPQSVKLERASQMNWDRDVANHSEGVGGHGLFDLKHVKAATPEQIAQQRQNDRSLDRGLHNHEEGIGGHGLFEAAKS